MLRALLHVLQPKNRAQLKDTGVLHEEGSDSSRRILSAVVEILINNQSQQLAYEAEKVNFSFFHTAHCNSEEIKEILSLSLFLQNC